ncbi:7660_t:CDS:2 [Entrophospora sp. SA101]|nr:7660_t:CDS:2 [Entrophospora sp. SA101]
MKIICLVETGDMLNIGFSKPLETIIKHIEKQTQDHQMILFSPKISIWVKYIVKKYMKNQYVEVDFSKSLSEGPTEKIYKYNILEQIEKKILFPLIGAFITSNKNNLTLDQIIGKISYTNNSGRLIKNISPVINSGGKYLSWEDTIPDNIMTADLDSPSKASDTLTRQIARFSHHLLQLQFPPSSSISNLTS